MWLDVVTAAGTIGALALAIWLAWRANVDLRRQRLAGLSIVDVQEDIYGAVVVVNFADRRYRVVFTSDLVRFWPSDKEMALASLYTPESALE